MTHSNKTMKDVIERLRSDNVEALLEVFELHVAVGEVVFRAQAQAVAMRELAAEAAQLANTPGLVSPGRRLQALADYARRLSDSAEGQAKALLEVKLGLDGWNIA